MSMPPGVVAAVLCVSKDECIELGQAEQITALFFPLRALQQSNPVINCLAAFGSPASSQTSLPIFSSAFSDREEEVFVTLTPLSFIDFAQKSLAVSASRHLELSSFDVCSECLGVQMCAETRAWRMCGRHLFRPPKSPFEQQPKLKRSCYALLMFYKCNNKRSRSQRPLRN